MSTNKYEEIIQDLRRKAVDDHEILVLRNPLNSTNSKIKSLKALCLFQIKQNSIEYRSSNIPTDLKCELSEMNQICAECKQFFTLDNFGVYVDSFGCSIGCRKSHECNDTTIVAVCGKECGLTRSKRDGRYEYVRDLNDIENTDERMRLLREREERRLLLKSFFRR